MHFLFEQMFLIWKFIRILYAFQCTGILDRTVLLLYSLYFDIEKNYNEW